MRVVPDGITAQQHPEHDREYTFPKHSWCAMKQLIKKVLSSPAILRLSSAVRGPPRVVLMYHDVRADSDFKSWMRVSESAFEDQLAFLERSGEILSPEEFFDNEAPIGRKPRFLITFDDGYVNNFRIALPILDRHDAHALFFVSTRPIETQAPFWSEILITTIQSQSLDQLDLRDFGFGVYRFRNEDTAHRWSDIQLLLEDLKSAGNEDHARVSDVICYLKGNFAHQIEPHIERFRPLQTDEIVAMHQSGRCAFGAHGHSHAIMTYLDKNELRHNLLEPKRRLENLLGASVGALAYPNGDFDKRVVTAVAKAGYRHGFTTQPGVYGPNTDPLRIPRVAVGGYDSLSTFRFNLNRVIAGAWWDR